MLIMIRLIRKRREKSRMGELLRDGIIGFLASTLIS